jgi:hypothetical protein
MYVVFFSTSNVFRSEELLTKAGVKCEVVPTPATDRAYCGVCLKIHSEESLDAISGLEYVVLEE